MRPSSLVSSLPVFLKSGGFAARFQKTGFENVSTVMTTAVKTVGHQALTHIQAQLLLRGHDEENHTKIPYGPSAAAGRG